MKTNLNRILFVGVVAVILALGLKMSTAKQETAAGPARYFTAHTGLETALMENAGNAALSVAASGTGIGAPSFPQSAVSGSSSSTDTHALPVPKAHEALVADLTSGRIYFELNADSRWPMASITKLVTGAFAESHMTSTAMITATKSPLDSDYSPIPKVGLSYPIGDMYKMMFTFSSNGAAQSLADNYDGDFVKGMNDLVKSWGMDHTYFAEPTGLSSANQSTAQDLFILAQKIYAGYPELLEITRTQKTTVAEADSNTPQTIQNINIFAGEPEFIGGKTGFTGDAQQNLLSIFKYHNRPIAIIVLGTNDRFGETSKLYSWFKANFQ